jgi:hypothetical protein
MLIHWCRLGSFASGIFVETLGFLVGGKCKGRGLHG